MRIQWHPNSPPSISGQQSDGRKLTYLLHTTDLLRPVLPLLHLLARLLHLGSETVLRNQNRTTSSKTKQSHSWIVVSDIPEATTSGFGSHYNWQCQTSVITKLQDNFTQEHRGHQLFIPCQVSTFMCIIDKNHMLDKLGLPKG